jgi:hypothetical protein
MDSQMRQRSRLVIFTLHEIEPFVRSTACNIQAINDACARIHLVAMKLYATVLLQSNRCWLINGRGADAEIWLGGLTMCWQKAPIMRGASLQEVWGPSPGKLLCSEMRFLRWLGKDTIFFIRECMDLFFIARALDLVTRAIDLYLERSTYEK